MPVRNPWLVRIGEQFARLRARIETFVSGRAPDDPLYLSNRSWKQKLLIAAVVAVPVIILVLLVMIAATDVFRLHKVDPYERPVAESQTAPVPTPVTHSPDPTLTPADLEVVNIHIVRDAHPTVTGVVRNNTGQQVESAEVSYYLADDDGSLLGTESINVENVAPHGSVTFHLPLKQTNAAYVLVRDVHVN